MNIVDIMTLVASLATAIGVLVAGYQIRLSRKMSTTQFEDSLTAEYRALVRSLPVKSMLGDELTANELEDSLPVFYCYFDLCNEQIFLRQQNRISSTTWENWREGIQSNFGLRAFEQAWERIGRSNGKSFTELKQLEKDGFNGDPRQR